MNSIKYKLAAVLSVVVLVLCFLYLNSNQKTSNVQGSADTSTPGFSVVPVDSSLLIADHSPVLGPEGALVTIVEFLDPECEACRAMHPIVKQIMDEHQGLVKLVVRYMPFHANSMYAASVLEAAREQGKYWEALHLLFEEQPKWGDHHEPKPQLILPSLKSLNLNLKKIEEQVKSGKYISQIEKDQQDGQKLGVRATPTFFVNGTQLYDIGYGPLKAAIEQQIANSKIQ